MNYIQMDLTSTAITNTGLTAPVFLWGLVPPYPDWWPRGQRIMLSAAALWWTSRGKFVRRSMPEEQAITFLDCGGFVAMNRYGDYPWSIGDYVRLVFHQKPDFAACMDYPCEPDIRRGDRFADNKARIDATLDNAAELLKWQNGVTQFVPVIQGYTIAEYEYCIGQMAERGLFRPYMAVGSMCRRWKLDDLREKMTGITNVINRVCESCAIERPRLHWFGLHTMAIDDPVCRPYIATWDSTAWTIESGTGKRRFSHRSHYARLYEEYRQKLISRGAAA